MSTAVESMTGQAESRPAGVPFVDLAWQHEQIREEILPKLHDVMSRGAFIQGAEVEQFESEFAGYSGTTHCVGVANGTDAIELALRAAGVEPGSDVVLPANTFFATAEAVVRLGANPVLVDCDDYGLIDVTQLAGAVTPSSSAVIPVHLYGQIADMEQVQAALAATDACIIEDAAQAQGATRNGLGIGAWGRAAATSFYPGKNLGAYGDAGAVITNDDEVALRVRCLANHGSEVKYVHSHSGFNSRLDTLQAVVLSAKLRRLERWNSERRWAAELYRELLSPLAAEGLIGLPRVAPGNLPVWHLYVVRVANRASVATELKAKGIDTGIHYPIPLHLQAGLAHLGYGAGAFPVAEAMAREILSLPMYPGISAEIVQRVAGALEEAVRTNGD